MKKNVRNLVFSVLITIVLVLISIPLWEMSSGERVLDVLASASDELSITVNAGTFPSLIIIEDDRAFDNIEATPVLFRNPNDKAKKFAIYYLYDKKSTIDYNNIVLGIENEIYHIKDLDVIEEDDYYYFKIKDSSLGAYTDKSYNIRLWLDKDTKVVDDMSLINAFVTQ